MGFIPAERARDFMSPKLYVGNLPYETSESDLQALFEGAGSVASVNIVRDRATGQARGFALVEMNDDDGARRAITEFDKHEFGGRNVTLTRRGRWRLEVMAAAGSTVAVVGSTVAVSRANLAGKAPLSQPGSPRRSGNIAFTVPSTRPPGAQVPPRAASA